ncbi:hypothetical protein LEN26_000256 [Aphanomyces euteiches]|nr:hypothetical protein AeMF1_001402 [Aphanomyces euteiches]KAH9163964.1 hypothetical protein LEN26_000256 [Aphanomyces euteiches]KAH9195114.1 hypothetical protein AeNC1_002897 [Aphanomyces euteiches]
MSKFTVAAVQMISRSTLAPNLDTVRRLVGEAAASGASVVLLPEYWGILGRDEKDKVALKEPYQEVSKPMQQCMQSLAKEHSIWLIGGTVPLDNLADTTKVFNSTLVYNPRGDVVHRYDKIHLFGYTPGNGQIAFDEARTITRGDTTQTPVADLPLGRVGLSVCYDLRFPEFYRAMGPCSLIVVPAAFTHTTGKAHWEILLRARAIENQCYVLASAQGGVHENGRQTWGQSMLIDPWGTIVAQLPEGEGIVVGDVDLDQIAKVRQQLPALNHRCL